MLLISLQQQFFRNPKQIIILTKKKLLQAASFKSRIPTILFEVQAQSTLQGVYNVNKGYAVFKQIDILYQNEEYTIVKAGTDFGISIYDHIALEGDAVSEDDLIN